MCRALIAGGGAPEIELSQRLMEYAQTVKGMESYCIRGFAESLEVIPLTLAENAGLNPIAVVTELRQKHAEGQRTAGINVRKVSQSPCPHKMFYSSLFLCAKGTITDILEENVVQPLLVSVSAIRLASECVRSILKIDDIVSLKCKCHIALLLALLLSHLQVNAR